MSSVNQQTVFYSASDLAVLDKSRLPLHIAIIPDGNRRWAKRQQSTIKSGHREGADNLMDIIKAGKEIGLKMMTFYLFSTENWNRAKEEVDALMWLLPTYLIEQKQTMIDNGIRLRTIGDLSRLPKETLEVIDQTKEATSHCQSIDFVMALNYGGRDEMCRAFHTIINDMKAGKITQQDINEDLISDYLDTAEWSDPDLLIRTSGELRFSNFLLWQSSYSEVYIEEVLWPDFSPHHLLQAIVNFQKRDRRLGGA